MAKVTGVDHLSISVSNLKKSKAFYGGVLKFLGFKVLDEMSGAMGCTNGKTRLWISQAAKSGKTRKHHIGDIGFHHYAFRLSKKKDVDDLQRYLLKIRADIVDPAGEYYENYYGVYFNDPDGLKLEGMWYGRD